MVAQHGFDRSELRRLLGQAKFQPQIVAAMDRPVVAPPKWYEYAPQFLAAARVDDGVAFWDANAEALARAEAQYGVPAAIVVAIVGVETFYGSHVGRHRVLDALATLAFDYPRRAAFFRGELAQFLLLSRELGLPPLALNGSFAGAMGLPQFMPGSYRNFAVDFDADGRIDLWKSASAAIGSASALNWPSDSSVAFLAMAPLTAGHSLLPLAKYACASSPARYSRKRRAFSGCGACLRTPAPAMLRCVPNVAWSGQTSPALAAHSRSSGLAERSSRA